MDFLIVTRHPGAVAWLNYRGIYGTQVAHLDLSKVTTPTRIVGVLPIPIVAEALAMGHEVLILVLPAIASSERGYELTPAEMDMAGAKLLQVNSISLSEFQW